MMLRIAQINGFFFNHLIKRKHNKADKEKSYDTARSIRSTL